jgi:hypothetical protein
VARRLGLSRGAVIHRAQNFGLLARQRGPGVTGSVTPAA